MEKLLETVKLHGLRLEEGSEPVYKILKPHSLKHGDQRRCLDTAVLHLGGTWRGSSVDHHAGGGHASLE